MTETGNHGVGRNAPNGNSSRPPGPDIPADFIPMAEQLPADIDRRLGYVGGRRFVSFRYEARGEEVAWDDGHTYGFGAGGWCAFFDRVAPLASRYGADLGLHATGPRRADVLVLDRGTGSAYFARRDDADRFLARVAGTGS